MGVGITSGGPVSLIYGLMFTLSGTLACAASVAEMASICPISGAQYHWTYMFAPKKWKVFITFIQGTFKSQPLVDILVYIEYMLTLVRMGHSFCLASNNHITHLPHVRPAARPRHLQLSLVRFRALAHDTHNVARCLDIFHPECLGHQAPSRLRASLGCIAHLSLHRLVYCHARHGSKR